METLELLMGGLAAAASLETLLAVIVGVVLGLFISALPGVGPAAGVAILLPLVVAFPATVGMAALAGIYYGAMYGGAVTSILLGIPGDSPSVMTVLDGYPLARKGRAGQALAMNVYASFIGGLVGLILLTALAHPVARWALAFGPAEMAALMVLALSLVTVLGGRNAIKGFVSLALGLWIGLIGLDVITGRPRYTFGQTALLDGISFPVIAVGLFGLAQIFAALEQQVSGERFRAKFTLRSLFPNLHDFMVSKWDLVRGSLIGFCVGVLPGAGATSATMIAYAVAKRFSKHPERFGEGAIEGVAAPEAANNSAAYSAMIPLFTLGVPGSATTAVLMGGLLMVGLRPGPLLFQDHPDFIWTLIGTFYIGNLVLVFLTLAMIPVLASVVYISKAILFPIVLGVVVFGVYSINYSLFDVWLALGFGVVGYIMIKLDYPAAPAILGVVLGPMLERAIRRTLIASQGDITVFFERPIALTLLLLTAVIIVLPLIMQVVRRRGRSVGEATP
jgi:putative tricarboxylic transport membrane protein